MRVLGVEELKLQDFTAAIELYGKKKKINVLLGNDVYRITGISFSGIAAHFKYRIQRSHEDDKRGQAHFADNCKTNKSGQAVCSGEV